MRRRYEAELIPHMMAIGISYNEFWTLNPRKIKVIVEGYRLQRQVRDEEYWMLGGYIFDAVSLAMGNSFRKKGQKPKEYFETIKEPILKRETEKNSEVMSELEKRQKTELLFKNLEIMAANHRLSQGSKVS